MLSRLPRAASVPSRALLPPPLERFGVRLHTPLSKDRHTFCLFFVLSTFGKVRNILRHCFIISFSVTSRFALFCPGFCRNWRDRTSSDTSDVTLDTSDATSDDYVRVCRDWKQRPHELLHTIFNLGKQVANWIPTCFPETKGSETRQSKGGQSNSRGARQRRG